MSKAAIKIENLSKSYSLVEEEDFFALNNINLKIFKNEKVAIIGDNGAGKTTLLKILSGVSRADSGFLEIKGKVISLISLTAGFHPEFTGRENIYLNASLLGLTHQETARLETKIIDFSGISKFIDQNFYTYSSGMMLRLGFSVAVHLDPDILILDEEVIVGDQDFQAKAYQKIEQIFTEGKTVIVSSHWLAFLKRLCNRFIWLDQGKIKQDGESEVLISYKKHRTNSQGERSIKTDKIKQIFELFKALPIGEKFETEVGSGSMEPALLKGEKVWVERVELFQIKRGDILVFWSEEINNIVMHRFYKKEGQKIICKGDSNILPDVTRVDQKNILGKLLV